MTGPGASGNWSATQRRSCPWLTVFPRGKRSRATTGASSTTWPTAWPAMTTTHRIWCRKRCCRVRKGLERYQPGSLEGWLARIVTNVFLDEMRRRKRRPTDALPDDPDACSPPRPRPTRRRPGCRTRSSRRSARSPRSSGCRSCCATSATSPTSRSPNRPACRSAPSGPASTGGAACCAPRWPPGGCRAMTAMATPSIHDFPLRRISTASSPSTSGWRSRRSSRRRPSCARELEEVTVARAAVRGLPQREAPAGFWDAVRANVEAADDEPDVADRRGVAPVVAIESDASGVAHGLDRRRAAVAAARDRGRRRARAQRRCVRTSPRWPRSTAPPRPNVGDSISSLVPMGPLGGTPMNRRFAVVLCVVALTGGRARRWPLARRERRLSSPEGGAPRPPDARGTAGDAVLRRRRASPGSTTARPNDITVAVTGDNGAIEVDSGQARVFDTRHPHVLQEPARVVERGRRARRGATCPRPTTAGRSVVRRGPTIVGRPTHVGRGHPARRDRRPEARTSTPTPTCSCAARCSTRAGGCSGRSSSSTSTSATRGPHDVRRRRGVTHAARRFRSTTCPRVRSAEHGRRATSSSARSRHPNGVELLYSDGLFTVSVFEQRGELDWDGLPKGGVSAEVGGNRARRYVEPERRRAGVGAQRHGVHLRVRRAARRDRRHGRRVHAGVGARSSRSPTTCSARSAGADRPRLERTCVSRRGRTPPERRRFG